MEYCRDPDMQLEEKGKTNADPNLRAIVWCNAQF